MCSSDLFQIRITRFTEPGQNINNAYMTVGDLDMFPIKTGSDADDVYDVNGNGSRDDKVASYICGVGVPLTSPNGKVENVVALSFFREDNYLEKLERMKEILFKYKAELEKYLI